MLVVAMVIILMVVTGSLKLLKCSFNCGWCISLSNCKLSDYRLSNLMTNCLIA